MEALDALNHAERMLKKLDKRRPFTLQTDEFYEGKHPLTFASKEWAEFHKGRYTDFSDNWCAPVADAVSERIVLAGVNDKSLMELWAAWDRNDGQAKSSQGFQASIVNSVSYALVWGNKDDEPLITFEHASEVILERDPATGEKLRGLKHFVDQDNETEHLAFYTKDDVWKWYRSTSSTTESKTGLLIVTHGASRTNGWAADQGPSDDTWPIRNPMGRVPFAEFENRPRLSRGPLSDIAGTMSMQNAINLLWAYLFGAADHASMPARVVSGQEPPKIPILDENGQKISEKAVDIKDLAKGRLLWLTGQNTKIDQWTPANLKVFTEVIEISVGHIAAQTRTPPHYLNTKAGMSNLSGDALVAAETGLVKKAMDAILYARAGMRDLFQLVALVKNQAALAETITSRMFEFENPGMRSESQLTDALLKKRQMGYPFEYLLELDGVGPEDRKRIQRMRREEMFSDLYGDGVGDHVQTNDPAGDSEVRADAAAGAAVT